MDVGLVQGAPAAALLGKVSRYYGFREATSAPMRRREGPGRDVVLISSFGEEWLIDGERLTSFAAGVHDRQVTTEHGGRSFGMHIDLAPPAAYMLFGLQLHTLAHRKAPLEDVLDERSLVNRLHDAGSWTARVRLLVGVLLKRLADARPPSPGVVWAWRRLVETDGRVAVGALAEELGEEIGLPPKAVARLQPRSALHDRGGDRGVGSRPSGATPGRFHPDDGTPPMGTPPSARPALASSRATSSISS